jgi:hypothetical protein
VVADIAKLSVGREAYYTRELATDHQQYLSGHGESPGRWSGAGATSLGRQGAVRIRTGRDVHDRPQVGPVTGQVGTELTFFITVTGCASSNKQPSFKVVDGRLPQGTKLFDFAGSTGLINGVPTTAGSFRFTVQVKDETRATDTETFTIQILPPEAPTITTEALSGGTVGEVYCCGNLFASGGVQPYSWSVVAGALPAGLELPRRENTISGTRFLAAPRLRIWRC